MVWYGMIISSGAPFVMRPKVGKLWTIRLNCLFPESLYVHAQKSYININLLLVLIVVVVIFIFVV